MVHRPLQALGSETRYSHAASGRLIAAVQQLSLARDLPAIMEIVCHAARELTGADGATFVLREGSLCYYAKENAIAPLWKGQHFLMAACISGWAIMNRQPAIIEDVFSDPRIPANVYRSTFVKSLAMVPIRAAAPVGAIGTYWAKRHEASLEEVQLLQALADSTSIAMENAQVYSELEQCVKESTAQLKAANKELQAFSYSVSHDLRAPLRAITGFSQLLYEHSAKCLDDEGCEYLHQIRCAAWRMGQLIDALLNLARITQAEVRRETINLTQLATEIVSELQAASPERHVEIEIAQGMVANGDPHLVRVVLENLLSNAWKYTSNQPQARITFGCMGESGEQNIKYYVQDNGAGFDMTYAYRLFNAFQRLHTEREFPGTGVGLVTVQRIIQKHGGHIWAEAAVDKGATFYFTLL